MKSITIHQTLHGYSEGHRLLDGSLKFSTELSRVVMRMSDLSGSNVVSGFEEYLTGYPLEAMNLYALAKTWYASEMPRPGCVWTHTLLVPTGSMADISDLRLLNSLFLRPQNSKSFARYSSAIRFDVEPNETSNSVPDEKVDTQVLDLLETLYRRNKGCILIGAQSSRAYESAILRLWSQQWPKLRNCFTFCTGALSARGFGGKPFDIQCTPLSMVREITAASASKQSQDLNPLAKAEHPLPSWLMTASDDALKTAGGNFRRMLWEFADSPNRELFVPFAQLVERLINSSSVSVDEIIKTVAEQFPSASAGKELKSAVLGTGHKMPGFPQFEEGQILAALASTSSHESFNPVELQLRTRARELCSRDQQSARQTISQLFRSPFNPLGEEIVAGMVEAMNPELAQAVTKEYPQFLPTLFRAKPELGASPELWIGAGHRKRELFESLISHKDLGDTLIEKVVRALLTTDSEFLLKRALETWGRPAVFAVFDTITSDNLVVSETSAAALTFHVESILSWLLAHQDCPQHVIIQAAHIIAPYTYQFRQSSSEMWLRIFRELSQQGNEREANYMAALILALGLQNAPPDALSLVEESFERIHQVAWDDKMPDDIWLIMEPIVPHLWWLNDWDKCERLRRGLIEAFIKFRWPVLSLAECVKNDYFLSRVLESARNVEGGRELISQKL